jgi:hypothetical protein
VLTAPTSGAALRPTPTGPVPWRATLRAWVPAARGLPLPTIAAVLTMAAVPCAAVVLRGDRDLSGALVAAAVIGATAVAFFVDDPAGETISGSPTSLARRRLLRLGAIVLGLAALWAVLVGVAAIRGPLTLDDLALRAAEAAAASGLAAAAAGLVHRHAVTGAGAAGGVVGGVGVLMISSFAFRFHQLPALMQVEHHGRWWLVALAGWAVAAWSSRDPAR